MGVVGSKDTRRISFDNTFAVTPTLISHKSIEDDNALDINAITTASVTEKNNDLIFPDTNEVTEIEERRNEVDYWANRIENLKQEHLMINKIIETEFEKALENTNKLLEEPSTKPEIYSKVKPCFEWRSRIMQCYEENPQQPLNCSPLVQAFNQCVTSCSAE